MRRSLFLVAVGLVALGLAGSVAPAPARPQARTPTYDAVARPVRDNEIPLHLPAVKDGDLAFTLLGLTPGMKFLIGSHAEFEPKGQFVRIHLVVENVGRVWAKLDTDRQLLLTSDGQRYSPDVQSMAVKRQPRQTELGSANRLEFDLYYDVPKDLTVVSLWVEGGSGDGDPDGTKPTEIRLP